MLKHAEAPKRVEVVLRYLDPDVELTVRDDGRGHAGGDGQGQGLTGMRERVALHAARCRPGPGPAAATRCARGCRRRRSPASRMTRVFLVDDQALVRAGLRMVIDSQGDMTVVGEAEDGREALEQLAVTTADVVLMDVRMPKLDGVTATRLLLERDGAAAPRVIVLTTFDVDESVFPALRAGASGFLLKNAIRRSCWRRSGRSRPATRSWRRRRPAGCWSTSRARCRARAGRRFPPRRAERARAGDPARGRARAVERGDRRRAAPRGADGQDLPRPAADQARHRGPGAAGDLRLRQRAGRTPAPVVPRDYTRSIPQAHDPRRSRP